MHHVIVVRWRLRRNKRDYVSYKTLVRWRFACALRGSARGFWFIDPLGLRPRGLCTVATRACHVNHARASRNSPLCSICHVLYAIDHSRSYARSTAFRPYVPALIRPCKYRTSVAYITGMGSVNFICSTTSLFDM